MIHLPLKSVFCNTDLRGKIDNKPPILPDFVIVCILICYLLVNCYRKIHTGKNEISRQVISFFPVCIFVFLLSLFLYYNKYKNE